MVRRQRIVVVMSELSERLKQAAAGRSLDAVVDLTVAAGHPVSRSQVARLLNGTHGPKTTDETLIAMAAALDLDVRDLRELAGRPRGAVGPYIPTDEAGSLTEYQRNAMDELIRAIVRGEQDGRMPGAEKMRRSMQAADDELARRRRELEELRGLQSVASTPSDEERARRKAEEESVAHIDDENQDPDWD